MPSSMQFFLAAHLEVWPLRVPWNPHAKHPSEAFLPRPDPHGQLGTGHGLTLLVLPQTTPGQSQPVTRSNIENMGILCITLRKRRWPVTNCPRTNDLSCHLPPQPHILSVSESRAGTVPGLHINRCLSKAKTRKQILSNCSQDRAETDTDSGVCGRAPPPAVGQVTSPALFLTSQATSCQAHKGILGTHQSLQNHHVPQMKDTGCLEQYGEE